MTIINIDNINPSFGRKVSLKNVQKSVDKLAKDLNTTPEMLAGAGSATALSTSEGALMTANYSGLAKALPVNVSIPLSTGAASSTGYEAYLSNAKKAAKKEVQKAKRNGEPIPEQSDPDFVKAAGKNIWQRLKTLLKIGQ